MLVPNLFVIRKKEFDHKKNEWSKSKVIHVFENRQSALDDYFRLCNSTKKTCGVSLDVEYSFFTYCVCDDRLY